MSVIVPPPAAVRRIAFLGSPALAVPTLEALLGAGYDVPLVVSRADKRRARGGALLPSPVKAAALAHNLAVTANPDDLLDVAPDLAVVVAFGRLIKPHLLERFAFVNLHFSLLPRWRGAAPVERALLAGDEETGVCVMALEESLDTGGVYRWATTPIGLADTLVSLQARLVELGTGLLLDCLAEGFGEAAAQQGEAIYAAKLEPGEFELSWQRPAVELDRLVRLGRAWTTFRGRRLAVHAARVVADVPSGAGAGMAAVPGSLEGLVVATGAGGLELVEVQAEGKARQPAAAWRNGARPNPGELLGAGR